MVRQTMGSSDNAQVSKLYYRIGEVAKLLGVEPSAIRHWESEFVGLRPRRTKTGQRVYSQHDVQRLMEVKHLRFDLGYTIRGARKALRNKHVDDRDQRDPIVQDPVVGDPIAVNNQLLRESLLDLRERLLQLIDELDRERSNP